MATLGAATSIAADPFHPGGLVAANGGTHLFRSRDEGLDWAAFAAAVAEPGLQQVAPSPARPGLLYVAGDGGVYASLDGGRTFGRAGTGLPRGLVSSLLPDPAHPDQLYTGVATSFSQDPGELGVYVSRDRGATWSRLGAGLPAGLFSGPLALDAAHRLLYAGTIGAGVYRLRLPGRP